MLEKYFIFNILRGGGELCSLRPPRVKSLARTKSLAGEVSVRRAPAATSGWGA